MHTSLILYAEHEFNSSTFTARVIAGTGSDIYSCITGAIGALRGPKHGGANEVALEIQERYDTPDEADADIRQRVANKEIVIGFGHPVYTVSDPRNVIIKRVAEKLAREAGDMKLYGVAERIETLMMEREAHVPESRLVQRRELSPHGRADRHVHAAVRDGASHRLERARHRAARGRQDHSSRGQLRGAGKPRVRAACAAALRTMSSHDYKSAQRPSPDELLVAIADYTKNYQVDSPQAYETARYCLMDTLACGFQALKYPACTRLLGPVVPGATMPGGSRVPGTSYELDPVMGAFSIGAMVRWLDFNDTWLAAEWGHPSDNLGAILALADYLSRRAILLGEKPLTMRDVLTAMIKAHEIQGVLALENSFNRVGLDHVLLVRVASTAVATAMLGGSLEQIVNALSNAWIDGGALRTYRHAPNTGSRKSWAAGDATSRAVRHALFALKGEMGYPSALSREDLGIPGRAVQGQVTHAAAVRSAAT